MQPGAAQAIEGAVAARRHEPGARVLRQAIARPGLEGQREGILERFFGEIEIAEEADQGCEHTAALFAVDPLDGCRRFAQCVGRIGLTSIEPTRALGTRAAIARASSRSLASIR